MQRLRAMDSAVLSSRAPSLSRVLAVLGLAYGLIGGTFWLLSGWTFGYADAGTYAFTLLAFPWSALPLALIFRAAAARPVGVAVAAAALLQILLARGSWGLELAYVPLVIVGLAITFCARRPGTAER